MISTKFITLSLIGFLAISVMIIGCGMQVESLTALEKYPVKPITMIVPYTAGGSPDLMARAMEKVAVKYFGQPLVVVNKVGGAGTIGWNELAGAKPDGYTISYVSNGVILQPLYGPTRYHYATALEPLAQVATLPVLLAVRADQPWKNIDDLVQYAKLHPGEIKYGHSGLGTGLHVVAEMFTKAADINMAQVPFRGESESLAALLGGHVQFMTATPAAIRSHVKNGTVRVLAVAREERLTDLDFENVPTFKERKLDVVFNLWYGVGAPKDLPNDVKNKLTDGLKGMLDDPGFKKTLEDLGMTVEYLGPQEFSEKWLDENVRLTKVIKETGIAERIAAQKN